MNRSTPDINAGYRVDLDAFHGPLDLLLHLVKRQEVDLHDISMSRLAEQYLEQLEGLDRVDVERAGEFLVVAATLIEMKSRTIVPALPDEEGEAESSVEADNDDPRGDLIRQLLAYKRYRDAAGELAERAEAWSKRFGVTVRKARVKKDDAEAEPVEIDLEEADILTLASTFERVLESIGGQAIHDVGEDETPLSLHMEDMRDLVTRAASGGIRLGEIFAERRDRMEQVGLFLAVLELVRQRELLVEQGEDLRDLMLRPASTEHRAMHEDMAATEPPSAEDLDAFAWPDEAGRTRAERRLKRRQNAKEAADRDEAEGDGAADQADTPADPGTEHPE
ncbi:segregation and condensation protein A [Mucisphaera calidilacus]|uniref:Segregation and condensation protein A n=1 Tax=Mucisphaera calidilacus TaxID=2527982 RepID=A0A518BZC9_9BACT|nr:segregation/condensation protein A [Mucisphaera calidilacus]QDU72333.1 Segregation and condensation protein A [Mucisphaera calidilacus]